MFKRTLIAVASRLGAGRLIGFRLSNWLKAKSPAQDLEENDQTDDDGQETVGVTIIEVVKVLDIGFFATIDTGDASLLRHIVPGPNGKGTFPDPWSAYKAALKVAIDQGLIVTLVAPSNFDAYNPPQPLNVKINIEEYSDFATATITSLDYKCNEWEYFNHDVQDLSHYASYKFPTVDAARQAALATAEIYGYNVGDVKVEDLL